LNPPGTGATDWNVVSICDLNSDGRPDLIYQNRNTGQLVYWLLNGPDLIQWGYLIPDNPGSTAWKLVLPH
jgi:hypothetical protein